MMLLLRLLLLLLLLVMGTAMAVDRSQAVMRAVAEPTA
jgi:hypothetical protein